MLVLAAAATTLLVTNQLNVNADTNSTSTVTSDDSATNTSTTTTVADDNASQYFCFGHGRMGLMTIQVEHGFGGHGQVQVSDEFKENVTSIASADSDVQDLLNNGYNVTAVTPILQSTVDGNGYVTTRASTAILTLTKDDTNSYGRAQVLVNIDQATVTKIYTETRTLIEK